MSKRYSKKSQILSMIFQSINLSGVLESGGNECKNVLMSAVIISNGRKGIIDGKNKLSLFRLNVAGQDLFGALSNLI